MTLAKIYFVGWLFSWGHMRKNSRRKKPRKTGKNIFGSAEVTWVRLEVPKEKIPGPAGLWDLAESSVAEGWELYQPFCLVLEQSLLSSLHMLSLPHVNLKKGMTSAALSSVIQALLAALSKGFAKEEKV